MMTPQEKRELVDQHRQHIESALNPHPSQLFYRRKILKTLHPETLPALVDHGFRVSEDHLRSHPIPKNLIDECVRLGSFAFLNDVADYLTDRAGKFLHHNSDKHVSNTTIIQFMLGLMSGRYSNKAPRFNHYSQASPEERAIQRAVLYATMTINRKHIERPIGADGFRLLRLASTDLVRYIADNPDHTEEVIALINAGHVETTEESLNSIDGLTTTRNPNTAPTTDGAPVVSGGMAYFARFLSRKSKSLVAARVTQIDQMTSAPIPLPTTGIPYEETNRSVMIEKLVKDIRYHAHSVDFTVSGRTCDTCDTDILRRTLNGYSNELLYALNAYGMAEVRGHGVSLSAHEGRNEAFLRTCFAFTFSEEYNTRIAGKNSRDQNFVLRNAVASLPFYDQLPYEDSNEYYRKAVILTGTVVAIMREANVNGIDPYREECALLRLGHAKVDFTSYIASDALVEFIFEHPDQWERIAEIAVKRKTSDTCIINAILNSDVPSLSDGLL